MTFYSRAPWCTHGQLDFILCEVRYITHVVPAICHIPHIYHACSSLSVKNLDIPCEIRTSRTIFLLDQAVSVSDTSVHQWSLFLTSHSYMFKGRKCIWEGLCANSLFLSFSCQQLCIFIIRIGRSKGNIYILPLAGLNSLKDHRTATLKT